MSTSMLDRVRQPEYTGTNRCIPCTTTNIVIAVVLSLAVGSGLAVADGPFAWLVGGSVLVASLVAIWLRGYLVPGTPELTKRYFPEWLLRVFDKEPAPTGPLGGTDTQSTADGAEDGSLEEIDAEAVLLSAGVVEPCEDEDDLCLVEGFRSGWREQIRAINDEETERDELARELDLDSAALTLEEHGEALLARTDGRRIGQWESRAALVADLAAGRELPAWVDDWAALSVAGRSQLVSALRIFLNTCPACEGVVAVDMETVESCCSSHDVVAATCETCEARLLELRYPEPA